MQKTQTKSGLNTIVFYMFPSQVEEVIAKINGQEVVIEPKKVTMEEILKFAKREKLI